jgi:nucleoside-diphosphate-sugar epimerase
MEEEKSLMDKILVNKEASIKEAMKIIDNGSIKMALVVDNQKCLCGVITDGDIRRGIINGIGIEENVSTIMNPNPICVFPDTPREEIVNILKKKEILGVPLVDKDNVVNELILMSGGNNIISFNKQPILNKKIDKVLVIGGAGYVGSLLVRKLISRGYKVNVLDNFLYGKKSLRNIKMHPSLKIIEGDTRHIEDVSYAIKDVDAVIHLAELVGDPACALNPSTTQEINYLATKLIGETCKHFQINRLIYASSCSVYGASEKEDLLTEDSPTNPVSLYAKMKISSERALKAMQDTNFLPTILRFSTVFGSSPRPRFDLVVNTLTAKAVKDKKISIFGGDQWRPNVHVEDISDTIIKILEADIEIVGGETFNVGSERNNYTINELGKIIKEVIPEAELVIDERKVDKRNYRVSFEKLRKILGIEMKWDVIDGVKEIKEVIENEEIKEYNSKEFHNIKFLESNLTDEDEDNNNNNNNLVE